jgi:hypothetical protein
MTMHQQIFGFFSVACAALGYGIYLRSVLKGKTKPHLFSWLVWSVVIGLICIAQLSQGAAAGAWATGFSAVSCLVIGLLAIKRGEKNITPSDWMAFVGALAIIPLWRVTQNPLWAVILGSAVDALAYYPTYRKSYAKPFEENYMLYTIDILKWSVAFFALGDFSATTIIYPIFCISANALLVVMILYRRSKSAVG